MWGIIIAIVITIAIILIDGRKIWKNRKKNKMEFSIFYLTLSAGFLLWVAYSLDYEITTPLDGIKLVLEPLSKKLLNF
ncbi:hypothetical protein FIU87_18420 [Bacillus sp. THAF10]|uniref:hypothetical protein n=1 Tax=Bacillus sp. THAF10 TaxID=2587848 RepID=UPI0012A9EDBA|nr:hypothetical protein [Bacillus sp. THAF10]QFT90623.1 hypothetical protein FIU87_18420 [Bacillus sp. THAF10]